MDVFITEPMFRPSYSILFEDTSVPASNSSKFTMIPSPILTQGTTTVDLIFFLLAPLVGFISNGTFQITAWRNVSLRKNAFAIDLIVLSLLDILACICCTSLVYQSIFYFNVYFHYLFVGLHTIHSISTLLVVLIAWERYKAICHPMQTATSRRNLRKVCLTHAGWMSSGSILLAPSLFLLWRYSYQNGFPYFYIVFIPFDVLALIVTVVMYTSAAMHLRHEGKNFQNMTSNRSQYLRRERNLCAMTFINTVVFFALVVGQHILPGTVFLYLNEPVRFFKLQLTCSLANASVNPIIYNIFGRQYRKAFIQTMVCRVSSSSLSSRNSNIV